MATTREQHLDNLKQAFLIKAIPFLNEVFLTCNTGYNDLNGKQTANHHGVPQNALPAMLNLGILNKTGNHKTAKYHWKKGVVSKELAEKIYDRMNLEKRLYMANKKTDSQFTSNNKNLVKVIGTKRLKKDVPVDSAAALVLTAMQTLYALTKDGHLLTKDRMVTAITDKFGEVLPTTKATDIVATLITGNYFKAASIPSLQMYTWQEQEPNAEHAAFVVELMAEQQPKNPVDNHDRADRIFSFLQYLYTLKEYTTVTLRDKVKEYKLQSNDQAVVAPTVLESVGSNRQKMYRWKLVEAPTLTMAQNLVVQCRAYEQKYSSKSKQNSRTDHGVTTVETIIKPVETVKIDTVNPPTIVDHIAVALEKLYKEKAKQYTLLEQLQSTIADLDTRILEGENLLALRNKEQNFLTDCAKYGNVDQSPIVTETTTTNVTVEKLSTKAICSFILASPEQTVTTLQLRNRFCPGANSEDLKCKALYALIYYMKKQKHVSSPTSGVYTI